MPSLSYIPQMSMTAVFDILVVAFLVYEFLKLVKGTRAIPMLVAVVILGAAFWIAHFEALKTVDWLITTLLPYAIFALIVVFGAEIRHALARLGRRLPAARGGAFNGADSYEDIVLAANHFSQTVTGALIVIEREIGLRTFIESGVPLDANLSFDLLVTIFRPSAPLHDGAVIVQRGRIAAAACFLPLSMNPLLSTLTGALIVIEREIGLRTFIESGVPLDANLSINVLVTIFRPSAPLHAGAVIVQKGRIAAAACFLPLSMNPVL